MAITLEQLMRSICSVWKGPHPSRLDGKILPDRLSKGSQKQLVVVPSIKHKRVVEANVLRILKYGGNLHVRLSLPFILAQKQQRIMVFNHETFYYEGYVCF